MAGGSWIPRAAHTLGAATAWAGCHTYAANCSRRPLSRASRLRLHSNSAGPGPVPATRTALLPSLAAPASWPVRPGTHQGAVRGDGPVARNNDGKDSGTGPCRPPAPSRHAQVRAMRRMCSPASGDAVLSHQHPPFKIGALFHRQQVQAKPTSLPVRNAAMRSPSRDCGDEPGTRPTLPGPHPR